MRRLNDAEAKKREKEKIEVGRRTNADSRLR